MSALDELTKQILVCPKCEALVKNRTRVVPGEGAENADIMFIGEAPGRHEDQQGRPFVGQAGQYLEQLFSSINLKRSDVFITNVIKCRPPENRDPLPTEIQNCNPWLRSQIGLIKPKIIVILGRHSLATFFPSKSISKIHGTAQKQDGIVYFAMYHPAAALYQQSLRQAIEEDIKKLPSILSQIENKGEDEPGPQQLSLF